SSRLPKVPQVAPTNCAVHAPMSRESASRPNGSPVTARAFEIDEDEIGIDCADALEQLRNVVDVNDALVPSRAQAFLENRRAQRILVDNGNAQIPAQQSSLSRRSLSSTWRAKTNSAPDLPDGRSRAFSGEVDTGPRQEKAI